MGAFPTGSTANSKQGNSLGLWPTVSPHISGIYGLFPWSTTVSLSLIINRRRNIKMYKLSTAPNCDLSNHSTISQTQTGATVPLNIINQKLAGKAYGVIMMDKSHIRMRESTVHWLEKNNFAVVCLWNLFTSTLIRRWNMYKMCWYNDSTLF